MAIFVIGLNHKTALIALREKLYFSFEKLGLYLKDLLSTGCAHEAVLLSTCNRSELYCEAEDEYAALNWFCEQAQGAAKTELAASVYVYKQEAALEHIMEVACGLDSMVLGEPQILGQMKEAFSESCSASAVGSVFHRLFQEVFAAAKEVRTTTAIGACPVSVASAAVHFARSKIKSFAQNNIVIIGAGATAELLLQYLKPHLKKPVIIINRHGGKAYALAQTFGAQISSFTQLREAVSKADVVFSATGSPLPLITKEVIAERYKLLTLIDIAVPRDIAADVDELENVTLYCIDHLKTIIESNLQGREHAAEKAREMIRSRSFEFMRTLRSLDRVSYTIRAYRGHIEDICEAELLKAKDQLFQGHDPIQVLDAFARMFTKKLLHTPSIQLRQAGAEGKFELLRLAKQLFAIPDSDSERL